MIPCVYLIRNLLNGKVYVAMKESRRRNPRQVSPETKAKIAEALRRFHSKVPS